ncbi:hypothetical protein [Amycolatopsis aidingensis]|uniref:hypothetical protein n=1 Tax=Amycolatopsis aidingensis TaxID=2842453 RepID=UPI001C0DACD9|nr:hypothetical protein [Amycolatopsis aidingensis]
MRVPEAEARQWPRLTREARRCWYCRTTYPTSGHATRCEQVHEAETRRTGNGSS